LKRLLQYEHAIGLIGFYIPCSGCTLMAVIYQTISPSKVQSSKAVLCEAVELVLLKCPTHSVAILIPCSCGYFELILGFTIVLKGKNGCPIELQLPISCYVSHFTSVSVLNVVWMLRQLCYRPSSWPREPGNLHFMVPWHVSCVNLQCSSHIEEIEHQQSCRNYVLLCAAVVTAN
jgi:hypothetical protein